MFEDTRAKVVNLKSVVDGMQIVLADVRQKLVEFKNTNNLNAAAKAEIDEINAALDDEAADVAADLVENTPAEEPPVVETPVEEPVTP